MIKRTWSGTEFKALWLLSDCSRPICRKNLVTVHDSVQCVCVRMRVVWYLAGSHTRVAAKPSNTLRPFWDST